jgi:E3 ubiquitin-protein ligase HERC1
VTPLKSAQDCRLVLRCLAHAIKAAGSPLAATRLHAGSGAPVTAPVSEVRLALSQLIAPPAVKASDIQTAAHPISLQAQAVPLLYLLASGDPRALALVPPEWAAVGEAMALMRSVFTRGPLPHAVLVKSISSFSEKVGATLFEDATLFVDRERACALAQNSAWSLAMDKQLTRLVQARQKAKATQLGLAEDPNGALPAAAELELSDMHEVVATVLLDNGLYNQLQPLTAEALFARSRVLRELNEACFERLLPWVDLSESTSGGALAHELCALKPLLQFGRKRAVFIKLLEATNSGGSAHQLVFDRREAARAAARAIARADAASVRAAAEAEAGAAAGAAADPAAAARAAAVRAEAEAAAQAAGSEFATAGARSKPLTMFEQFCKQVRQWHPAATEPLVCLRDLRNPGRAFSVRFEGEAGNDAGGLYRETLDSLVAELHSRALPLLLPTPNESQTSQDVFDRGSWMLNPAPPTPETIWQLQVMGALIGLCLRTRATLPFELAVTVWQGLLGETCTLAEYERVDKAQADFVARVRDNSDPNCPNMEEEVYNAVYGELVDFTIARSDQQAKVDLKPGGASQQLTYATRHEWAALAEAYLVHECDVQLAALRAGLSQIVPLESLYLLTPTELERLVIGEKDWSVLDLKRGAEVRGHHEAVHYLWEVLGEFSPEEKALFCRFAWGRSRMPERCAGVKFIVELVPLRGQLPVAHTCFFQLDLPRYTSKEVLKEKLLSAIYYCKDMDLT